MSNRRGSIGGTTGDREVGEGVVVAGGGGGRDRDQLHQAGQQHPQRQQHLRGTRTRVRALPVTRDAYCSTRDTYCRWATFQGSSGDA